MLKIFTPLLISSTLLTHQLAFSASNPLEFPVSPALAAPMLLDGEDCDHAVTVTEGTYTAPNPDYWYVFTVGATGTYVLSSCFPDNTCDTRIYLYSYCLGLIPSELAEGTLSYNDDYCGTRSQITTLLTEGDVIYIRIGDAETACAGQEIIWSLTYAGETEGCTDTYACNWSPIAMIDDGSCIYAGNPDCPSGP
ncbi:MAG: hypothetical protein KAX72_06020, partial [Chitinophagales bacterium]|nr:hypothetical protein [Chitinophagales bacterium]